MSEDLYFRSLTYYFKFKGEINTDLTVEAAIRRAKELNVKSIVIASETGRSALRLLKAVKNAGLKIKIVVVTHPPDKTWGPRGDILIGINHPRYRVIKECLEKAGAFIVQGTRPFASAARSLGWDKALPDTLIDYLLGGLLGQGVKVAIEAALMATDAGAIKRGEPVISMAGTYKGLDSAVLVKTTYSYYFLKEFEILEIIAKPWEPRVRLPEYEDRTWRGNLDKYYEEPTC